MDNKTDPDNTNSKPKSEPQDKGANKFSIRWREPKDAFNSFTGLSGFIFIIVTRFFHGALAEILFWLGIILMFAATHFEIVHRMKFKYRRYIAPCVASFLIFAYFLQPNDNHYIKRSVSMDSTKVLVSKQHLPHDTIKTIASDRKSTTQTIKKVKSPSTNLPNNDTKLESGKEDSHLPVVNVRWISEQVNSTKPDLPFEIKLTLQTTVTIEHPHFQIICNKPLSDGEFTFASAWGSVKTSVITQLGETANGEGVYEFSCESPNFIPQRPMIVFLFAKEPFKVIGIRYGEN